MPEMVVKSKYFIIFWFHSLVLYSTVHLVFILGAVYMGQASPVTQVGLV
jgi:hypothetical protein